MAFLRNIVLTALVFEAVWAGYEWWKQIHDLMALFAPPGAVAALQVTTTRPVLAAVAGMPFPSMAVPTRRVGDRMIASVPAFVPTEIPLQNDVVLELAKQYLEEHRVAWQLRPYHEFRSQISNTPIGTHVIFTAQQDGVDIEGMTIDITYAADKSVSGIANLYQPLPRAETSGGQVEPAEAIAQISDRYAINGSYDSARRVLAPPIPNGQPELAYWLPVKQLATGRTTQALFRASDGRFLREELTLIDNTSGNSAVR